MVRSKSDPDSIRRLIREGLAPLGANLLVLEVNTHFQFSSHPQVSDGDLTPADARELAALCRDAGIRLVPLFNCLGHQGWAGKPNSLLRAFPDFDETPHISEDAKYPEIYCRSWCPSHPDVNRVAFALLDELIDAFQADALHAGLDEVFLLAEPTCPRCRGRRKDELFAQVVGELHDHLTGRRGVEMWMWGDRLIDGQATGYGEWEGDILGIWPAVDRVPRDILITDWHYEKRDSYPSVDMFLEKGFRVLPACWRKPEGAAVFMDYATEAALRLGRADLLQGMLVTCWAANAATVHAALMGQSQAPDEKGELRGQIDALRAVMGR